MERALMIQSYDPTIYWNGRCKIHGHTGYADELLYSYDQPLRIRAIKKVASCLWPKIAVDNNAKILDIGCGTGDLLSEFAENGVNLTGIDISNEVILKAKERFLRENIANVSLFTMKAEEIKFPTNTFNLVTCMTVLQHITDERLFSIAVKKIVNVVKNDGYILILEKSPFKGSPLSNFSFYITIRSRQEYICAFEGAGCTFVNEIGIPQIGIKFLQGFVSLLKTMRLVSSEPNTTKIDKELISSTGAKKSSIVTCIHKYIRKLILKLSLPLDYFFLPFPKKHTDYRVLIFQKNVGE